MVALTAVFQMVDVLLSDHFAEVFGKLKSVRQANKYSQTLRKMDDKAC